MAKFRVVGVKYVRYFMDLVRWTWVPCEESITINAENEEEAKKIAKEKFRFAEIKAVQEVEG